MLSLALLSFIVCIKLVSCSTWENFEFDSNGYYTNNASEEKRLQAISVINSFIFSTTISFNEKRPLELYTKRWKPLIHHVFPGAQLTTLGLPESQFKAGRELIGLECTLKQGKLITSEDVLFSVTVSAGNKGNETIRITGKSAGLNPDREGYILKVAQAGELGMPAKFAKAGDARELILIAQFDPRKVKRVSDNNLEQLNKAWKSQKERHKENKNLSQVKSTGTTTSDSGSSSTTSSNTGDEEKKRNISGSSLDEDTKSSPTPNTVKVGLDQEEDYKEPPAASPEGIRWAILQLMQDARQKIEAKSSSSTSMDPLIYAKLMTGRLDHGLLEVVPPKEESTTKKEEKKDSKNPKETMTTTTKSKKAASKKGGKGAGGKDKKEDVKEDPTTPNIAIASSLSLSDSELKVKEKAQKQAMPKLTDDPKLIKPWTIFFEGHTLASRCKAVRAGFSGPLVTDPVTGLQKMHIFYYIEFNSKTYNKTVKERGAGAKIIAKEEEKGSNTGIDMNGPIINSDL